MYQHPFAQAMPPAIGDYTQKHETKGRSLEAYPAADRVPAPSQLPKAKPEPDLCIIEFQRLPRYRMTLQDAGITVVLNGQEEDAAMPEYGVGATLDGTISFANPINIIRQFNFAKIEGHVTIEETAGSGSSDLTTLSELLVFWDAPNRLGGYSSGKASGDFAPQPGSCPRTFPFKSVLPTHYTDADGSVWALPPSFSETLPGIPGFHSDVRYDIKIRLTRVRDVSVKTLRAQWKRNTVFRIPVEYRPRTRPSRPTPFPCTSNKDKGPVTRFTATFESSSSLVEPIKTILYLPNSPVMALSQPIPFFLRVSGPESMITTYSRPPLSSFLPKTEPDSFPTICSIIGHVVNENLQNTILGRILSLPGERSDSWTALEGEKEHERRHYAHGARSRWTRGTTPSNGVRVTLVRVVTIHPRHKQQGSQQVQAHAHSDSDPQSEFDVQSCSDARTDSSSFSFVNYDGSGGRTRSHMFKRAVLGEGVMYIANVSRGSITWAGEIHIDPKYGVRTGGFCTGSLSVRDMLIVSIRESHPDMSSGKHREFQQVIPIQLTTDPFMEE